MSNSLIDADSNKNFQGQTVLVPFLVGAVVGGLAGAVVGTALSPYTNEALTAIANAIDRIASRRDKGQPKFELLLQ